METKLVSAILFLITIHTVRLLSWFYSLASISQAVFQTEGLPFIVSGAMCNRRYYAELIKEDLVPKKIWVYYTSS